MSKIAFITGITGQDGSYMAELLIEKGYKIYGIVRRTSLVYTSTRLDHIRSHRNSFLWLFYLHVFGSIKSQKLLDQEFKQVQFIV